MSIFLMFYYTVSSLPRADSCETRQNQRFTGISSDCSYYDTIIFMYGTFTHSELFCRLPHCCIMINDVMCDLYRPLLDIFLHRFPLHSLFLQCMQRKSSSFIHSDKR